MRPGIRHFVIGISTTAAVLGLVVALAFDPVSPPAQAETVAPRQAPAAAPSAVFKGEIVIGAATAPVTVIEYASMTCPHCANFHLTLLPKLKEKYIDGGKVKLLFREFPLDGLALRASMLARCGGEAKVHSYIDVLFGQQNSWAGAQDPLAALARIARMGGMSQAAFEACMADEALMQQIVQSRKDGVEKHQINSTPGFVIDGKTYSADELDLEGFSKIIDPLLPPPNI